MPELIPSLLVESHKEFERRLRLVEDACETVHVDILDGSLFPAMSWADPVAIGAMRTPVRYEIHLMVENPLPIVEAWKKNVPGFIRAIVHAEMHRQTGAVVAHIRDLLKLEAGVALNPESPLEEIHAVLGEIDQLTIMGVHPGASGQAFLGEMVLEKIRAAHARRPDLPIEIDGGVRPELVGPLLKAGCSRLCSAGMLFHAPNPGAALREARARLST